MWTNWITTYHNNVYADANADNSNNGDCRVSVWFTQALIMAEEALLERFHAKVQLRYNDHRENYEEHQQSRYRCWSLKN